MKKPQKSNIRVNPEFRMLPNLEVFEMLAVSKISKKVFSVLVTQCQMIMALNDHSSVKS